MSLDYREQETYRERFLVEFLRTAFPVNSKDRLNLELIFIGDVNAINLFEQDLKNLFSNCLDRIHYLVATHNIPDSSNLAEFEIWYRYYQQNFEQSSNEVHRNILSHLKIPREYIRITYKKSRRKGSWVFYAMGSTSVKMEGLSSSVWGMMNKEIELVCGMSFINGLAHCILNGYYGLLQKGSLEEAKTLWQISMGDVDLGNAVDNHWSLIDSEIVRRLADQIVGLFPYRKSSYLDCVELETKTREIFFFLNLLKFGQLSILYRDNMQVWRTDEFEHSSIVIHAQDFYDYPKKLLNHSAIHDTLAHFLKEHH